MELFRQTSILRYNNRVIELRQEGYGISCERMARPDGLPDVYLYRLVHEPQELFTLKEASKPAYGPL